MLAQFRVQRLFNFIQERHAIYQRRIDGQPKPWTKDPILRQYRFCNVYRELDTVTQWIAKEWRFPHRTDVHLWFAMAVARLVNWPTTLEALDYPCPWSFKHFREVMQERGEQGKAWGGAYIVSTNGNKMEKPDYIGVKVLTPLWEARDRVTDVYTTTRTLAGMHACLTEFIGLGSFLSAQVIADLRYVAPLCKCTDLNTWASSGPGSRRGLNRIVGSEVDEPWREEHWLMQLQYLQRQIAPLVKKAKMSPLHAQDLQNCLCEFDKYERARLGEGRPKARYDGGTI